MRSNMQAYDVQSRQARFVRYCLYYITEKRLCQGQDNGCLTLQYDSQFTDIIYEILRLSEKKLDFCHISDIMKIRKALI